MTMGSLMWPYMITAFQRVNSIHLLHICVKLLNIYINFFPYYAIQYLVSVTWLWLIIRIVLPVMHVLQIVITMHQTRSLCRSHVCYMHAILFIQICCCSCIAVTRSVFPLQGLQYCRYSRQTEWFAQEKILYCTALYRKQVCFFGMWVHKWLPVLVWVKLDLYVLVVIMWLMLSSEKFPVHQPTALLRTYHPLSQSITLLRTL